MVSTSSLSLPLAFLRLTPLITSSAAVMCGLDQHAAFSSFLAPTVPPGPSGSLLPHWFPVYFSRIKYAVAILYPLGIILSICNVTGARGRALDQRAWLAYAAGGLLSAAHFLYGPGAMRIIGRVWDKDGSEGVGGGKGNYKAMGEWMGMNRWRMLTVDGPAWVMFVAAAVLAARF